MNYSIFLDEQEIQLLQSLVGQMIEEIQTPGVGYSVRFLCGKSIFDFTPEEFSTPEKDNLYTSVTRPIITNDCSQVTFNETKTVAKNFGVIKSIQILRTTIIFPPEFRLNLHGLAISKYQRLTAGIISLYIPTMRI